ncbi:MAG: HEAT repeat domain-containing protein [Myxococcota bacterium]|nr:HEAT repeat domain-containing protein [Myxococcota bacterium]
MSSADDLERAKAAESLRNLVFLAKEIPGAKETILEAFAVPGPHRSPLAAVLAEGWGLEVMPVLTKGLNPGGLVPATSKEEALNAANRSILTGMKQLLRKGEKLPAETIDEVIPYVNSGNAQTALVAIRVVGMLQNKKGTKVLLDVIEDHDNNFIIKNAIMALGDLRDPKAADTLITYLFKERGVSFYPEASFSLYQMRMHPVVVEKLAQTFEGKNKVANGLIQGSKLCQDSKDKVCWVLRSKVGEVLSDIGLTEAQVTMFDKVISPKANQTMVFKLVEAMGRTGESFAIKTIMKQLNNLTVREYFGRSIARIGDRQAALKLLRQGAPNKYRQDCKSMGYDEKNCNKSEVEIRRFTIENAARAGDNRVTAELEKMVRAETNGKVRMMMEGQLRKVRIYDKCQADAVCYRKLLSSDDPLIREKAAYELAYLKDEGSREELLKTIRSEVDNTNESRFAKFWALWRLGGSKGISTIEQVIEDDQGNRDYARLVYEFRLLEDQMRYQRSQKK